MLQERDYRSSIPRRNNSLDIPQWQFLRILNLSNNRIFWLPKELGALPHLKELDVSRNFIGQYMPWLWLEQTAIQNNLQSLNISNNSMTFLTMKIGALNALTRLEVRGNDLLALSESICLLENLKHLDASHNKLIFLPGSIFRLNLHYLNISWNPFTRYSGTYFCRLKFVTYYNSLPSLRELSAICVRQNRLAYDGGKTPWIMTAYLDVIGICYRCGKICFESFIVEVGPRCHHFIASRVIALSIGHHWKQFLRFLAFWKATTKHMLQECNYRPSIPKRNLDIPQWEFVRTLNLSNNNIAILPKELGALPHLKELDVSRNFIGLFGPWLWLEQRAIRNNLQSLNIGDNQMTYLTMKIGQLNALKKLDIHLNNLLTLPDSIGFMENLEELDVAYNQLISLPGTIIRLNLHCLNISDNMFIEYRDTLPCHQVYVFHYETLPMLVELSAICIRRHRIIYYNKGLSREMVQYLESAFCCYQCGNASYKSNVMKFEPRYHHFLASNVIAESIGDFMICVMTICFHCVKGS